MISLKRMGQQSSNWDQKQVIMAKAAGVFLLAVLFTVVMSGTNAVTGTETHPLAWPARIASIALFAWMALGFVCNRSGSK